MLRACKYHSDCFTCPFPDCIYQERDITYAGRTGRRAKRDEEIRAARLAGRCYPDLADQYGLSIDTIKDITVGCGKVGRSRKS